MPRADEQTRITPSIFDRLVGDSGEAPFERRYELRDLKRAVARDLEALLNTRRELLDQLASDYTEVARSLLTYGLPDFSAFNLNNHADRTRVRRMLEEAIVESEPRLERVRVSVEQPRPFDRGLRFRIDAVLRVKPSPEPVTFDAVLQLATQECRVEGQA